MVSQNGWAWGAWLYWLERERWLCGRSLQASLPPFLSIEQLAGGTKLLPPSHPATAGVHT